MKSAQKTIFVNPVGRISPQGRDKQTFTIVDPKTGEIKVTKSMNKTKEFGVGTSISFPYNAQTNRLETGLDKTVPNPFYKLTPEEVMEKYALRHSWMEHLPRIVNQPEIKKQTLFEINHDVEPNFYTSEFANGSMFSGMQNLKRTDLKQPNFLERFSIILYDYPNRFEDDGTKDTARGALAIELCNIHPKIAKNKQYINTARHDFYISEENEAEQELARKQDVINDAIYQLVELQRKGGDYKNYQTAVLLSDFAGEGLIKGSATPEKVKARITEYITTSDKHQMENISKFTTVVKLLETKEGRERFGIKYLIQQAINTGIIGIKDGYYIWYSKAGTPNIYKHVDYEKFVSLLVAEFKNSADTNVTNWYNDLFKEVKDKGIWLE